MLVDLPGVTHQDPNSPVREKPVELRANMSTLKRDGQWTVPRELIIRNRLGSTELDFSEATIAYDEVRITLNVSGGSVKLLLPERSSAVTDQVRVTAGSIKDKVGLGDGPAAVRGGWHAHRGLAAAAAGELRADRQPIVPVAVEDQPGRGLRTSNDVRRNA